MLQSISNTIWKKFGSTYHENLVTRSVDMICLHAVGARCRYIS